jgi:transposase IS116/IS110/IS902 family protein
MKPITRPNASSGWIRPSTKPSGSPHRKSRPSCNLCRPCVESLNWQPSAWFPKLGSLSRFNSPRQLMSYSGLVSSEHSSGNRVLRGGITKTGNAHLRRIVIESSWCYQHRPNICGFLLKRQKALQLDPEMPLPGKLNAVSTSATNTWRPEARTNHRS